MSSFKITSHRGFHLEFDNGLTLSTQFGPGNYCEHHPALMEEVLTAEDFNKPRESNYWESRDVEIAVWDEESNWVTGEKIDEVFPEDEYTGIVKGWVTMGEWLKVLDWCREYEKV